MEEEIQERGGGGGQEKCKKASGGGENISFIRISHVVSSGEVGGGHLCPDSDNKKEDSL